MPIPIIAEAFRQGSASLKYVTPVLKAIPWIALLVGLKYFFGGARNRSERVMHGKVVILTVCSLHPPMSALTSPGRHVRHRRCSRQGTRKSRRPTGPTYLTSTHGSISGRLHR
jgi:hypothetical protein